MRHFKIQAKTREAEAAHIDYTAEVPSGQYLIFPLAGFTVTMPHPGVPNVISDDGETMVIHVRYEFRPNNVIASRGDNTYPDVGDNLAYLVELNQDKYMDIGMLATCVEVLEGRIDELEKPKKRGRKPKKED